MVYSLWKIEGNSGAGTKNQLVEPRAMENHSQRVGWALIKELTYVSGWIPKLLWPQTVVCFLFSLSLKDNFFVCEVI